MTGLIVFGTRPEAIKLAPVIARLRSLRGQDAVKVVCSGQHRSLLMQTLHALDFSPDTNFDLMVHHQTPAETVRRIISALDRFLHDHPRIRWVLVQGDTATALAGALAAYLASLPSIHLEAGLRTHDLDAPWPEEGFRQLVSRIAHLHLAPTQKAKANLLAENIPEQRIAVVGNTGFDIQKHTMGVVSGRPPPMDVPYFLVTLHRRENLGAPLIAVCAQLSALLERFPNHRILWPRHPNPEVIETLEAHFGTGTDRLKLVEPMSYPEFLRAMMGASAIITDSGGVQEEGASLGIPVVVVREKTERPEIVELGLAEIAGGDGRHMERIVARFLEAPPADAVAQRWRDIQGGGAAAEKAARAILDHFP